MHTVVSKLKENIVLCIYVPNRGVKVVNGGRLVMKGRARDIGLSDGEKISFGAGTTTHLLDSQFEALKNHRQFQSYLASSEFILDEEAAVLPPGTVTMSEPEPEVAPENAMPVERLVEPSAKLYDVTDNHMTLKKAAAEVMGVKTEDMKTKQEAIEILQEAGLWRY